MEKTDNHTENVDTESVCHNNRSGIFSWVFESRNRRKHRNSTRQTESIENGIESRRTQKGICSKKKKSHIRIGEMNLRPQRLEYGL